MEEGWGVKNPEKLPTSFMDGPRFSDPFTQRTVINSAHSYRKTVAR